MGPHGTTSPVPAVFNERCGAIWRSPVGFRRYAVAHASGPNNFIRPVAYPQPVATVRFGGLFWGLVSAACFGAMSKLPKPVVILPFLAR